MKTARTWRVFAGLGIMLGLVSGCSPHSVSEKAPGTLTTALGRIKTLDPALADDVASGMATGHLYDRLLQYDYTVRPYVLRPSMAESLPEFKDGGLTVVFHLRRDLYFIPDPCFAAARPEPRQVKAGDVLFSFLRLADARVHSPGYWIFRGRIEGIDEFQRRTAELKAGDYAPYEEGIAGLRAPDDFTIVFRLLKPYPQLLNVLAMPYASVLPEKAARHYGAELAGHPVGSGPFQMEEWRRNYRFILRRNPGFRPERLSPGTPVLPQLERVVCLVVQEPLTAWLLFLQGNLDMIGVGADTLDAVTGRDRQLNPELLERGVRLSQVPEFQINYIGFNLQDPVLGRKLKLRQAISLAYNYGLRAELARQMLLPAQGPIPPGVAGYDDSFRNPNVGYDLPQARRLLDEAGYPGGIDPATGKPLRLRFDLGGTDLIRRQQAELMVSDMKEIGIEIEPCLNNWPRFLAKLKQGEIQFFQMAWVGDYPDAQNFLQVFYGPNSGGCNRVGMVNPEFDRLFDQAATMIDGPERTDLYQRMQRLVTDECVWIYAGYPVSCQLTQPWVRNYVPHHFAYDGWKYLAIDDALRRERGEKFRPLKFTGNRISAGPP